MCASKSSEDGQQCSSIMSWHIALGLVSHSQSVLGRHWLSAVLPFTSAGAYPCPSLQHLWICKVLLGGWPHMARDKKILRKLECYCLPSGCWSFAWVRAGLLQGQGLSAAGQGTDLEIAGSDLFCWVSCGVGSTLSQRLSAWAVIIN